MTANLSVTHRFTGIAMTGMMIGAGVGSLFLPMPFPEALTLVQASRYSRLLSSPYSFKVLSRDYQELPYSDMAQTASRCWNEITSRSLT